MMGAVLTELIAQSKGLDAAQRLPLVCAALTRDLGQIKLQPELDKHPGQLPEGLHAQMRQHPQLGAELLEQAGVTDKVWLETVRSHHEHLDGSGYPDGLQGDAIPLSARLMALADVFDALICARVYKPAMSYDEARALILSGSGHHFDPDVVTAFDRHFDAFVTIAERYQDGSEAVDG